MNGTLSSDRYTAGLVIRHRGKARTVYEIPKQFQPTGFEVMLVVASDSICAFGFTLSAEIADKAEITIALNVFWRRKLGELGIAHDLVACGPEIDEYLPAKLRGSKWLHRRAIVVKSLYKLQVECILRNHIAGTAWRQFKKTGFAYGHFLEPGTKYGSKLPGTIFTPKVRVGHVPLEFQDALAVIGTRPLEVGLAAYKAAYEYALSCGIIIADTNFEMGTTLDSDLIAIGGDVLSPDSSRYWDEDSYKEAMAAGKRPERLDNVHVRDHARSIGIDKYDSENAYDRQRASALPISREVCNMTTMVYSQIMIRLTKKDLLTYQVQDMNIPSSV